MKTFTNQKTHNSNQVVQRQHGHHVLRYSRQLVYNLLGFIFKSQRRPETANSDISFWEEMIKSCMAGLFAFSSTLDSNTKYSIHWVVPQICFDILLCVLLHSIFLSITWSTMIWLFFPLFFPVWLRDDWHCISLRCTTGGFEELVYCKTTTIIIALANTSTMSHNYHSSLQLEHSRSTVLATCKYIVHYYKL